MEDLNYEHELESSLSFGLLERRKPFWGEIRMRSWGGRGGSRRRPACSRSRRSLVSHTGRFRKRMRGKMRPGWEV